MVDPIGDRIRQAHAEHVAGVDPWEGAESTEKQVWKPPYTSGAQTYVAPTGVGDGHLEMWWDYCAGAVVLGDGTG
jgi:hypothetical protein